MDYCTNMLPSDVVPFPLRNPTYLFLLVASIHFAFS